MDLDVLERARSGDREAFRTLLAAWGDRVLRTAALITGDAAKAEAIVVSTFTRVWRELPGLHSERPFRPWLMRALLETLPDPLPADAISEATTATGGLASEETTDPTACLEQLSRDDRATVVLHLYDQMGATELGLMRGTHLGTAARGLRTALRAYSACAATSGVEADEERIATLLEAMARTVELPPWFADELLEQRLAEPEGATVRRLVGVDPEGAWARVLDPGSVGKWVQAGDVRVRGATRLEPGARISAAGRIAARRASRDETVITRADQHTLAWTTRSRIKPWPSAIEFRWTLTLAPTDRGCELIHTLRGVAFPPGASGRFLRAAYERIADAMPQSMHTGIEQLAQLLEAGARRAPL